MSRAKCDGDFYFSIAEKYYTVKPSSETAMFLAQAFQSKGDYTKAMKYLNEALAVETDPAERQLLLVRMALGFGFQRPGRRIGCPSGPRSEPRGRCAVFRTGSVLRYFGSSL